MSITLAGAVPFSELTDEDLENAKLIQSYACMPSTSYDLSIHIKQEPLDSIVISTEPHDRIGGEGAATEMLSNGVHLPREYSSPPPAPQQQPPPTHTTAPAPKDDTEINELLSACTKLTRFFARDIEDETSLLSIENVALIRRHLNSMKY